MLYNFVHQCFTAFEHITRLLKNFTHTHTQFVHTKIKTNGISCSQQSLEKKIETISSDWNRHWNWKRKHSYFPKFGFASLVETIQFDEIQSVNSIHVFTSVDNEFKISEVKWYCLKSFTLFSRGKAVPRYRK